VIAFHYTSATKGRVVQEIPSNLLPSEPTFHRGKKKLTTKKKKNYTYKKKRKGSLRRKKKKGTPFF